MTGLISVVVFSSQPPLGNHMEVLREVIHFQGEVTVRITYLPFEKGSF